MAKLWTQHNKMDQGRLNYAQSVLNHQQLESGPVPKVSVRQSQLSSALEKLDQQLSTSPAVIPARKTVKLARDLRFFGDRLYFGLNTRRNVQKACEWYTAAAKKGDMASMSRLVGMHLDGLLTLDAALKHAEKAAAAGYVSPAMLMLSQRAGASRVAELAPALARAGEARQREVEREKAAVGGFVRVCAAEGCGISGVRLKRCQVCKEAAYCGVECQRKDWAARHRGACGKHGGGGAGGDAREGGAKPARTMEARALRLGADGQPEGFLLSTGTMSSAQMKEVCSMMTKQALGIVEQKTACASRPQAVFQVGSKVRLARHVGCEFDFECTAVEEKEAGEWLCSMDGLQVGIYLRECDMELVA